MASPTLEDKIRKTEEIRGHELLTEEQLTELQSMILITDWDGEIIGLEDLIPVAKLFSPLSRFTFYVIGYDGDDTLYGYCLLAKGAPRHDAFLSMSLKTLQTTWVGGIPLERDLYFTPQALGGLVDLEKK